MFCFFAGFFKKMAPGVRFLARFICPRGRGFVLSLCPGVGNSLFQKKFPGGLPGGMARLGIDSYITGKFT